MVLKEMLVRLGIDLDPMLKGAQKFESELQNIGSRMTAGGFALSAAVTAPILAIGGASIKMGMDAVESENLFKESFKGMSDQARAWSESTSEALGLNAFELRRNSGLLFTMLSSMGAGKDAAFDMATGLTQLANDMASFYDMKPEEAFTKLRAGITGETEPLKALGILVDENTTKHYALKMGLISVGQEMTAAQKTQARYAAIMDQTKNASGDLARTLDSPANKLRSLKAEAEATATKLGAALLPTFVKVLGMAAALGDGVAWLVDKFTGLPVPVQATVVVVAGLAAAIGPALVVIGGMASGVGAIMGLVPVLSGGLGILGTAFALLTGPIGLTIAAIAGVIAAGYALVKWLDTDFPEGIASANKALGAWRTKLEHDVAGRALPAITSGMKVFQDSLGGLAGELERSKQRVSELTAEQKKNVDAGLALGHSVKDIATDMKLGEATVRLYQDSVEKSKDAAAEFSKGLEENKGIIAAWKAELRDATVAGAAFAQTALHMMDGVNDASMARLGGQNAAIGADMLATGLRGAENDRGLRLMGLDVHAMEQAAVKPTLFSKLGGLLRSNAGNVIQSAFQGGGNVSASIGGLLGSGVAENLVGSVTSKVASGALSKGIGSLLGSVIPVVGPMLGALGGKLVGKLLGGLFGDSEKDKTKKAMTAWATDSFGSIDGLKAKAAEAGVSLDKLFNAKKVKDFEAAAKDVQRQLGEFAQEHEADAKRLTAAIQKYGFTWEEVGAKTRNANLHEQAVELIEDWRVLVASGINVATVNTRMTDTVNEFLLAAVRVGGEVPRAMQPIIQSMIDQGLILDENGLAITDLGQLNVVWSDTMTQGFDRVVKKLEELIGKITGAGDALNNIPSSVDVAVNFTTGDFPGAPSPGVELASGGLVTRPTYALVGEAGPEAVIPLSRMGQMGLGGNAVGVLAEIRDAMAQLVARQDDAEDHMVRAFTHAGLMMGWA